MPEAQTTTVSKHVFLLKKRKINATFKGVVSNGFKCVPTVAMFVADQPEKQAVIYSKGRYSEIYTHCVLQSIL